MPIVVSHQPDLGLLARAGYIAGAGEYQRWQDEMAQRERMQMRALQSNLYSQQMAQGNAFDRMAFGASIDQQRDAQLQASEQNFRRQMAELDAANRMDELQLSAQLRRDQQLTEMESAGNADIVKFLTSTADRRLKSIDDALMDGYEFEGDGMQQYQAMLQQVAKIQQDPTVPGLTRAQAIFEKVNGAPIPKLKRPSFEQQVQEQTATVTTPDGRQITVAPVRELQVLDDGPEQPKEVKPATPTEMVLKDSKTFGDVMKAAMEALTVTEDVLDPVTQKTSKKVTPPKAEAAAKWAVDYVKEFEKGMQGSAQKIPTYNRETGKFE